jgi:hypothetical protein
MPTHASLMPIAALALALVLLASCGPMVDDPKNVPLRGRWQQETKIVSLVANDVWIDRDKAPFPLPKDKFETKNCFEPRLKTADEINDDLLQGTAKNCKFGEIVRKGQEITSEGVCAATEMGPVTERQDGIHCARSCGQRRGRGQRDDVREDRRRRLTARPLRRAEQMEAAGRLRE